MSYYAIRYFVSHRLIIDGEEDKCLHKALPVAAFLEILTKSVNLRATAATRTGCVRLGMGWVIKCPSQGAAAEMLPKTYDPTYSS